MKKKEEKKREKKDKNKKERYELSPCLTFVF